MANRRMGLWIYQDELTSSFGVNVNDEADGFIANYCYQKPYFACAQIAGDHIAKWTWSDYGWPKYFNRLGTLADSLGTFKILLNFRFENTDTNWSSFSAACNYIGAHTSLSIGMMGEGLDVTPRYTNDHDGWVAYCTDFKSVVESHGITFGNHYYPSQFSLLTNQEYIDFGPWLGHVNHPYAGENEAVLDMHTDTAIYSGQSSGIINDVEDQPTEGDYTSVTATRVFNHWQALSTLCRQYSIICSLFRPDGSRTYMGQAWRDMLYDVFVTGGYTDLILMDSPTADEMLLLCPP